jgi:hypothetical protein
MRNLLSQVVMVICTVLLASCASGPRFGRDYEVVRAQLIELGPAPNVASGSLIAAFRLARYTIEQRCRGNVGLTETEVVVAHHNGYQPEVDALVPGARVVLVLTMKDPMQSRSIGSDQPAGGSPQMQAALNGPGVRIQAVVADAEVRRLCRTP